MTENKALEDAIRRHLPATARHHIDRADVIAARSAGGRPMYAVESYDREYQPLKANISTGDGESVEISVRYEDGRHHVERWVDRRGEIVDGQRYEPELWAGGFNDERT